MNFSFLNLDTTLCLPEPRLRSTDKINDKHSIELTSSCIICITFLVSSFQPQNQCRILLRRQHQCLIPAVQLHPSLQSMKLWINKTHLTPSVFSRHEPNPHRRYCCLLSQLLSTATIYSSPLPFLINSSHRQQQTHLTTLQPSYHWLNSTNDHPQFKPSHSTLSKFRPPS